MKCNPHPNAPHGFLRDASQSAGRYVCECEYWNDLAEIARDHSDKGYRESTHEKQAEFANKRNYHYTNTDNPIDFPKS